jgi:hypothetical protein
MQMTFSRPLVLRLLEVAFRKAAQHDYANKYTENEEDLRASVYRYLRNELDHDERWRVFLSYSTRDNDTGVVWRKPDMTLLMGEPKHENLRIEILVEIKNWPTIDAIHRDIEKLIRLRQRFPSDRPDLVFLGIIPPGSLGSIEEAVLDRLEDRSGIHIWLEHHDKIWRGPWINERKTDPYREKLRLL